MKRGRLLTDLIRSQHFTAAKGYSRCERINTGQKKISPS